MPEDQLEAGGRVATNDFDSLMILPKLERLPPPSERPCSQSNEPHQRHRLPNHSPTSRVVLKVAS